MSVRATTPTPSTGFPKEEAFLSDCTFKVSSDDNQRCFTALQSVTHSSITREGDELFIQLPTYGRVNALKVMNRLSIDMMHTHTPLCNPLSMVPPPTLEGRMAMRAIGLQLALIVRSCCSKPLSVFGVMGLAVSLPHVSLRNCFAFKRPQIDELRAENPTLPLWSQPVEKNVDWMRRWSGSNLVLSGGPHPEHLIHNYPHLSGLGIGPMPPAAVMERSKAVEALVLNDAAMGQLIEARRTARAQVEMRVTAMGFFCDGASKVNALIASYYP